MSGRSNAAAAAARWEDVWRMHDRGTAQRAIARRLGIGRSTVQHFLAKGRPTTGPLSRPATGRRSGPPALDTVVAGSVRTERTEHASELMTIRCGGCGNEQDVHTFNHSSTCRECGRTCRFGAPPPAAENVIPIRRSS